MEKLSLLIPVFNEEENIDKLILDIKKFDVYNLVNEILFVNDGSTDNTLKKINKLKKNHSKINILNNRINMGQSYSLYIGCKKSKNNIIITIDGDNQNNPRDITRLVKEYKNNKELFLVGGIRKVRKDNLIKIYSSKIANLIRKKVLNDDCNDTGCSLKVFDRKTFLLFPYFNGIHRFLPALFKGYGKKTKFIEVNHSPRLYGKSKYGTFKRLLSGIIDMIRVLIIINKVKND